MPVRIKIITLIYVFILTGIVLLADLRGTRYVLNFVGSIPFGDKIGHFFLMGILSFLVNLTFEARTIRIWKLNYLLGSLIVFAVVTLEEFSQIYIRGRSFDLRDLFFDFTGIFLFGEIARFVLRRFSQP